MKYAIIDIETTGGSPRTEKITEIAIFIHDGQQVIDEFTTLINPERTIPAYITSLTGITNEMVADAPKFYEVAKEIVLFTDACIFVAHNANFDYGFIKTEFKNLGFDYQRKTLDTVRLSRKLLPGHASYSLGRLCDDLGIRINGRHRAAGDALATVKLFELLLQHNGAFQEAADHKAYKLLKGIDSAFHRELVAKVPEAIGVYYFFDEAQQLIYIGKSINLKKRVNQHLRNASGKKALELRQRIARVDVILTGSELVALLLESDEIKKHKPLYNRQQRRSLLNIGLMASYDLKGYINLKLERLTAKSEVPLATFANITEAKNFVFKRVEYYHLCQKLCGLYHAEGACFHSGIGQCKGACTGLEPADEYNQRAREFIQSFDYTYPNFLLIDKGRHADEKAVVHVKNGKYLGFGYVDAGEPQEYGQLADAITPHADNRDVQQIIRSYLRQGRYERLWPEPQAAR